MLNGLGCVHETARLLNKLIRRALIECRLPTKLKVSAVDSLSAEKRNEQTMKAIGLNSVRIGLWRSIKNNCARD